MLEWIAWILAGLLAIIAVLKLVFRLPKPVHDPPGPAAPDRPSTLADSVAELSSGHPHETGLLLLQDPVDALASRIAHARAATRSIDAQYFIWKGDLSGRMLLTELVRAAERGVRVRLLIDDIPTTRLDAMWTAANSLPNFEVRLFNPLVIRRPRALNYLFAALRLNRRMHNKTMTFDRCVSIVGGRNIGDEYFGAREKGLFIDLDALAVGQIVDEVADDFERYWCSVSSFPAEQMLGPPDADDVAGLRDPRPANPALAEEYGQAIDDVQHNTLAPQAGDRLVWAPVRLYSDNPAKALDRSERKDLVAVKIFPIITAARKRVDLVSGYFVPSKLGTRLLIRLVRRGVLVRIVTNSALATDKRFVHAGYVPYRKALLKAGAKLFEARPQARARKLLRDKLKPRRPDETGRTRFSGGGESVHAKTFTIDARYLFVGSFNFDPRSAMLNCEIGFIIDSAWLAKAVNRTLDERVIESAFSVSLGPQGKLTWRAENDDGETTFDTEPGMTLVDRILLRAYRALPVEWLL